MDKPETLHFLEERMIKTVQERGLFDENCAALLMVSGGSDSTALAYLGKALKDAGEIGTLAILHVNHQLRGSAADEDAEFVRGLADMLSIPFFLCEVDVAGQARQSGGNVEAVARHERYVAAHEALASVCKHEGYPLTSGRILTAHTADDRIENFYMRSIVGTGPGGFRSMLYKNGTVVRPLLDCTRADLRAYIGALAAMGAKSGAVPSAPVMQDATGSLWREDATNAHTDHFRAYVRKKIVPRALEWNPQMPQTLTRTMNLIADEDDMLHQMAQEIVSTYVDFSYVEVSSPATGEVHVNSGMFKLLPDFGKQPKPLQRRVLVMLMKQLLGQEERIDAATVDAVLAAFNDGAPRSGYVTNIQGNYAVSANKTGVLVEPMAAFRARRKKDKNPKKDQEE